MRAIILSAAIYSVSAFIVQKVYAQITITKITRASASSIPSSGTAIMYGGIAGSLLNCTGAGNETTFCNNCTQEDQACNTRRIHGDLKFRIDFTVTGDISGQIYLGFDDGGSAQLLPSGFDRSTEASIGKGNSGYVMGYWGDICNILYGSSQCDEDSGNIGSLTLYVHVGNGDFDSGTRVNVSARVVNPEGTPDNYVVWQTDPAPNGGLYAFKAHPGDEKVYIKDLQLLNCPTLSGATIKKVRIFHSPVSFNDASYPAVNEGRYDDFEFDSECEPVGDWVVEGLENQVTYFFRAAVLDEANNAVFINLLTGGVDTIGTCGANTDLGCDMIATPDNVYGLLPEDFNCFIATAAYGSPFADKVETLRAFRDRFLKTTTFGQWFIETYYRLSPPLADFIKNSPALRAVTRIMLWPIWAIADLSLRYGSRVLWAAAFFTAVGGLWISRRLRRLT